MQICFELFIELNRWAPKSLFFFLRHWKEQGLGMSPDHASEGRTRWRGEMKGLWLETNWEERKETAKKGWFTGLSVPGSAQEQCPSHQTPEAGGWLMSLTAAGTGQGDGSWPTISWTAHPRNDR